MRVAERFRAASDEELTAICQRQCKARCCRGVLLTFRDGDEAARISALAAERGKNLKVSPDAYGGTLRMSEHEGGHCPFLGEDNLCTIYEERPDACRTFPYYPETKGCLISGWERKPRVFVGTVHGREVPHDFLAMRDLVTGELQKAGMYGGHMSASSCRVDHNRNVCVEGFLKSEADYLLFLDDDMTFPPAVGLRLAGWEKDIVGGVYFQNKGGYLYPHVYRYVEDGPDSHNYGQTGHLYRPMSEELHRVCRGYPEHDDAMLSSENGLLAADAVATGCLLISRRVLEAMPAPWFRTEGSTNGDMNFFWKAKGLGFEVFADTGLICGHWTAQPVGAGAFRRAMEHRERRAATNCNTPEYWDSVHGDEAKVGYRRSYPGSDAVYAHLLKGIERPMPVVVDFGCGRGRTFERLKASVDDAVYVGIDHSAAAIEDNQRASPAGIWQVADVRKAPVPTHQADLCISNEVIEHMEQPRELLDEMWRVLAPGGYMAIGFPVGEVHGTPEGEHVQVFDWDRMIGLLESYGNPVWTFAGDEFRKVAVVQKPEVLA